MRFVICSSSIIHPVLKLQRDDRIISLYRTNELRCRSSIVTHDSTYGTLTVICLRRAILDTYTQVVVGITPTCIVCSISKSCNTFSLHCSRICCNVACIVRTVKITCTIGGSWVVTTPLYTVKNRNLSLLGTLHDSQHVGVIRIKLQTVYAAVRSVTCDMQLVVVVVTLDIPVVDVILFLWCLVTVQSRIVSIRITIVKDITLIYSVIREHEVTSCHEEVFLFLRITICRTLMHIVRVDVTTTLINTCTEEVNLCHTDDRSVEH